MTGKNRRVRSEEGKTRLLRKISMKIVVAPTSFKGSINVVEACISILTGIREIYPKADIVQLPVSDGGDGFLESLVFSIGGEYFRTEAIDSLGRKKKVDCGILKNGCGVVEMAKISGVGILKKNELNPLIATSYGTGELIKFIAKKGVKKIIVGVGGSATIDMGVGAMQALGVRFLDKFGRDVGYGGEKLAKIKRIDRDGVIKELENIELIIAVDVRNRLLGSEGAVRIYGKQKGLLDKDFSFMEDNLKKMAGLIKQEFGRDVTNMEGGGAAGGIGAGLFGVMGAEVRNGAALFFEITNFEERIYGSDLIITGEGRFDKQKEYGKIVPRILEKTKDMDIITVVLAGEITEKGREVFDEIQSFGFGINPPGLSKDKAIKRTGEFLQKGTTKALKKLRGSRNSDKFPQYNKKD
jgi:glycerate kinase